MSAVPYTLPIHRPPWPRWPYAVVLGILFFGPLAAPLFQATMLPLVADTGALARDLLSYYICPTPAKSYILLGFPMGVCARCWGATIGLLVAWPLATRTAWLASYLALPWYARLGVSSLPFWLWVIEIVRFPAAPLWLLLINGVLAGIAAGLFFCSVWPGFLAAQKAHSSL
ncbi:MAG TPA: DUF2085 domain-containing protein [Roseiflexaceae bacterium]|mgnify:CR=1 FL=1|nr:DUF2085 domain-containing protein [Roseiflexaceae bacterium]